MEKINENQQYRQLLKNVACARIDYQLGQGPMVDYAKAVDALNLFTKDWYENQGAADYCDCCCKHSCSCNKTPAIN